MSIASALTRESASVRYRGRGPSLQNVNLRADLVGLAVRVTDLEPGLRGGTEFGVNRFGGDAARANAVYAGTVPLTADDIAEAAS